MSPEHAKGYPADRRSALGVRCVLYEMLTGRRTFGGDMACRIPSLPFFAASQDFAVARDTPVRIRVLLKRRGRTPAAYPSCGQRAHGG